MTESEGSISPGSRKKLVATSPDFILKIIVLYEDHDIMVGFDGYPWHSHLESLQEDIFLKHGEKLTKEESLERFMQDILNDKTLLAISFINDQIQDVWPTDDPVQELKYKTEEEKIIFRFWSGKVLSL